MARSKKSDFFSFETCGFPILSMELIFVDSNPAAPRRAEVREINGSKIRISGKAGLVTVDLAGREDLIAIGRDFFAAKAAAKAKAIADYAPQAALAEAERPARLAKAVISDQEKAKAAEASRLEHEAAAEAERLARAESAYSRLEAGEEIVVALGSNFAEAKKTLDKYRTRGGGGRARYQADSRTWVISDPHNLIWVGLERGEFLPLSPEQVAERIKKFAEPKRETAHSLLGLPSFTLPGDFVIQ